MSHEGIRFVSADEAARSEKTNVKLHPETVTPAKVRVKQTEGTGVEIDWKDGHHSTWSFAWLRDACPCATCHESGIYSWEYLRRVCQCAACAAAK